MRLLYRIRDHSHIQPPPGKAHRGMTLVEALIALIIVFVALAAILVTVAQSAQMIARSREDLGTYTFASNWMELLETQPPDMLVSNFNLATENVAKALDPNWSGSGTINGYEVTTARVTSNDGIANVTLSILVSQGTSKKAVRFERAFNTISNATVSNDYANPRGNE